MDGMTVFTHADQWRRSYGALLEQVGIGPIETPYEILYSTTGMRLRRYISRVMDAHPVMLIIPAPIKRGYIWDMDPAISVVAKCLESGMGVYMLEWLEQVEDAPFGLAEYSEDYILRSVDAMEQITGVQRPILAGHSLGGTLAAIFSCLHPNRVGGLVLLESPLSFGQASGAFLPFLTMSPDMWKIGHALGRISGSLLSAASAASSPYDFFFARWFDFYRSLDDMRKLMTHMQVERWSLDELPMPGKLFSDIVELLYRDNQFIDGKLTIHQQIAAPSNMHTPLLTVVNPSSDIIPKESVLPFFELIKSNNKEVLTYEGDEGVALQHVGALVGNSAHRFLWPSIIQWMQAL